MHLLSVAAWLAAVAVLAAAAAPEDETSFVPPSQVGNCDSQAPPDPTPGGMKRYIVVINYDNALVRAKAKAAGNQFSTSAKSYKSVLAAGNKYLADCPDVKVTRLYKDPIPGFAFDLPADSPCDPGDNQQGGGDTAGGDTDGGWRRRGRSLLAALAADPTLTVYPDSVAWVGAASCRAEFVGDLHEFDGDLGDGNGDGNSGDDGDSSGDGTGPAKAASSIVWGDATAAATDKFMGPTYPLIPDTEVPLGVQRLRAYEVRGNRSWVNIASSVDIAIMSTGVAMHPDLNIAGSVDCSTPQLVGNTSMWLQAPRGCRMMPFASDLEWAGTAAAGIAAARNGWDEPHTAGTARHGLVGVAPGTPLWGIKVAAPLIDITQPPRTVHPNSFTSWSDILAALDWVKAHNAQVAPKRRKIRVILMPFEFAREARFNSSDLINIIGRPNAYPKCGVGHPKVHPVKAAICALGQDHVNGAVVVAAAGNTGRRLDEVVPAAWPEVLTVTAMADGDGKPGGPHFNVCGEAYVNDRFAPWSNFVVDNDTATENHIMAAPGVCIKTSVPKDTRRTEYGFVSGTEFAAAHVAGAVALCFGELKTNANYAPPPTDNNGRCKTAFEKGGAPAVLSHTVRSKVYRQLPPRHFAGDPGHLVKCPESFGHPAPKDSKDVCYRHFGYLFNTESL